MMKKVALSICLFSVSLIGMKKQDRYCMKKVDMDVVSEGMIPEKLLNFWVRKHNKAMGWVAFQKSINGIEGDPLPIYYKNDIDEK